MHRRVKVLLYGQVVGELSQNDSGFCSSMPRITTDRQSQSACPSHSVSFPVRCCILISPHWRQKDGCVNATARYSIVTKTICWECLLITARICWGHPDFTLGGIMANCRILLTPLNERDEQRGYSTQGLKRLSGTAKLTPGWGLRELSLCRNFRVNKKG